MNGELKELNLTELKALIYDEIIKTNDAQLKIKIFQDELNRRKSEGKSA